MTDPNSTYRLNSADLSPQGRPPRILFIEGVADDGLVKFEIVPGALPDRMIRMQMLGTLPHGDHVNIPGMVKETLLLVGGDEQALKFGTPSVIVNCIVDPDLATQALIKAHKVVETIRKSRNADLPVINMPAAIRNTTREAIYNQLNALPGLHFPRTARITPTSTADVFQQAKDAGIVFPFIVRAAGNHGGSGMQFITDASDAERQKLERYAFDGRAYYVSDWVDFKSADGLYRKSRLVCVNGHYIPRHRIISDDWSIHSRSRKILMHTREDLRKEEAEFLGKSIEESVSAVAAKSLRKVYETLGLDYFGIDCCINADGSLTIFEINAAFNAMIQNDLDIFPYLATPVKNIIEAFNDMVAAKAKIARAA